MKGNTWKGKERLGRKGKERHDKARKGNKRQGKASKERQGKARHSSLATKMNHKVQEYHNNHQMKTKLQSFINMKYLFNYSFYIPMFVQVDHWDHFNTDGIH
jgi:hypothetical protein